MKEVLLKVLGWLGKGLLGLVTFVVMFVAWLFQMGNERWRKLRRRTQQAVAIAVLVHVVILIIAAVVVAVPGRRAAPEIVTTIVEKPVVANLQQNRLSATKQIRFSQPSSAASMSKMVLAKTEAVVNLPTAKFDFQKLGLTPGKGNLGLGNGFSSGTGLGGGGGNSYFPMQMRGRCVPGERMDLLLRNGGKPEVEEAVTRALNWLQAEQNRDGTWGESYAGAMTGLALLCYLGRCETTNSTAYGETVTRGIQALMELGREEPRGYFQQTTDAEGVYEHGIATYALGEALAMAKGKEPVPGMRDAFLTGVEKIVRGQTKDGGWMYRYADRVGDLSVAGWQVQALKAAKQINAAVPDLDSCMSKAADFFTGRQSKQGGFGYKGAGNKTSLIGPGILSLQFLGKPSRSRADRGFEKWFEDKPTFDYSDDCDLYASYYMTQATFNHGGEYWEKWNRQCLPELLEAQSSSGAFPMEGGKRSEESAGREDDEIYRTTLCTLMLEVYYRYLPVNARL